MATPPTRGAVPPSDPLIGRSLGGHYRINSLLGRGGMSRVYKAVQAPLDRAVAVKVLRDDPEDPSLKRRFLFEASVTSQLTHPNTVTVFDYGVDQGLLFFAMELLRGSTLSEELKREGKLTEERTLHIARQVCRSLREAHAMGLVHRDLKPSNLFLLDHGDERDFVKVLDFGLVKLFGKDNQPEHITPGGTLLGTPHYMAPEQARGLPCDERSDIYSLGVVLFQMLAGHVPYDGLSGVDVLLRHATEAVPLLREAYPGLLVSAELEAVVAKCMAKKPDARFRNMDELLTALPGESARTSRPPALPLGWDSPDGADTPRILATGRLAAAPVAPPALRKPAVYVPKAPPPPPPAAEPRPAPRAGGRRGALVAGALVIAAIAGTAAWLRPSAKPGRPSVSAPAVAARAAPASATPADPSPANGTVAPAAPAEGTPHGSAAAAAVHEPLVNGVAAAPSPPVAPDPRASAAAAPATDPGPAHAATVPASAPAHRVAARPAAPPVAPKPLKPATPEVVEALNQRLARSVSGVRQCALIDGLRGARGPSSSPLELAVTVDPLGHVTDLALGGADLDKKLESCIRDAVKGVRFDPFVGAPVTLRRSISLAAQ